MDSAGKPPHLLNLPIELRLFIYSCLPSPQIRPRSLLVKDERLDRDGAWSAFQGDDNSNHAHQEFATSLLYVNEAIRAEALGALYTTPFLFDSYARLQAFAESDTQLFRSSTWSSLSISRTILICSELTLLFLTQGLRHSRSSTKASAIQLAVLTTCRSNHLALSYLRQSVCRIGDGTVFSAKQGSSI